MQPNLVVRNTFIDAVGDDEEDDDAPLDRSQSDPTGGRQVRVVPLKMSPVVPPIQEAEEIVESAADPVDAFNPCNPTEQAGLGEDDEDDDDDDDDSPLVRASNATGGYSAPSKGKAASPKNKGSASGSGNKKVDLTNLLPEDQTNVAPSDAGAGGYGMPMMWGAPYMMSAYPGMYNPQMMYGGGMMGQGGAGADGWAVSASSQVPELGSGPPLGCLHSFHQETRTMGAISHDFRQFTKVGYEGRLSVVSESRVHDTGVQRYLVQFAGGELSRADGVGFVFSPRLPCAKNIQRIVSIFVNQRGRICMRVFTDIIRASAFIKNLEIGDWVEMCIDLPNKVATFNVWPSTVTGWHALSGTPSSTAEFQYGNKLTKLNQAGTEKQVNLSTGHLACVVKNVGVSIILGS